MRTRLLYFVVLVVVLGTLAWLSPPPNRVTDREIYEATASQWIVPDCTDLHCFRVLVPWVLGILPGPSIVRWKAYAVVANAAAALAVFEWSLTLGLGRRAAWFASAGSALGFGSLYTLHDAYTADPLMYLVGPVLVNELVHARLALAGLIGGVSVLAKEFAAAPLFLYTIYAAAERQWALALRTLLTANAVFIVWAILQLTLILQFNYGYGGETSTHLLSGGGIGPWFEDMSLRGAVSAMFNEFGALYLLAPVGFLLAPVLLRRLTLAAAPIAAVLCYVQQPDRALWNFHFLIVPLSALVLERAPVVLAVSTLVAFALANFRVGAQLTAAPPARFALAASVVLAVSCIVSVFKRGAFAGGASDELAGDVLVSARERRQ